ncbi:MAG TPA: hypothetical protein VFE58_19935 [Tepidisphaeraceae bacterium]|nr:hypothetical protein [Tepidisphaeraceae bacterium]
MRAVRKILLYLWVAPTSLPGIFFVLLTFITPGKIRLVDGVLEVHGVIVSAFLKYLAFDAAAMTLGHVVLGRDADALEWSRSHERIHVRQCERWGPFFLPAYAAASLFVWLRGKRAYWDNPFEREAYQHES